MIPKFRVWNKKRGEFWNHCAAIEPSGKLIMLCGAPVWNPEDCEVSLSTGLKDCHGKEIYEGDIVRYNRSPYPYVVKWNALKAGLVFKNTKNGREMTWYDVAKVAIEIIGNVYENHELLQGEN